MEKEREGKAEKSEERRRKNRKKEKMGEKGREGQKKLCMQEKAEKITREIIATVCHQSSNQHTKGN